MKQNIILRIFLRLKETIIFSKIKSSLEGFVRNLLIISFSLQKVIMLRSSYRQEVLKILWISLFDSPNILNHLGKNYLTISNSDELGLQWHTTYNIKKVWSSAIEISFFATLCQPQMRFGVPIALYISIYIYLEFFAPTYSHFRIIC